MGILFRNTTIQIIIILAPIFIIAVLVAFLCDVSQVKWKIANVGGDNNRTASSTIVSGSVILTQLTLNGPNRQNADYTAQLNGYGDYTVAA